MFAEAGLLPSRFAKATVPDPSDRARPWQTWRVAHPFTWVSSLFRNCGCPVVAFFARAGHDAACTMGSSYLWLRLYLRRALQAFYILNSCDQRLPELEGRKEVKTHHSLQHRVPPLQKTQGRGTRFSGGNGRIKGWATRQPLMHPRKVMPVFDTYAHISARTSETCLEVFQ